MGLLNHSTRVKLKSNCWQLLGLPPSESLSLLLRHWMAVQEGTAAAGVMVCKWQRGSCVWLEVHGCSILGSGSMQVILGAVGTIPVLREIEKCTQRHLCHGHLSGCVTWGCQNVPLEAVWLATELRESHEGHRGGHHNCAAKPISPSLTWSNARLTHYLIIYLLLPYLIIILRKRSLSGEGSLKMWDSAPLEQPGVKTW